jgi:integrase
MPYQIINAGTYLDNQVKAGNLSRDDADLIHDFCEERKAIKHITESTALVTSKGLSKFAPSIAPFKQCTTQDIIKGINAVENTWKQNTRRLRIYYLIQFCLWLVNEGYNKKINVKKLNEIEPPKADKATKTASQMIPEDMIDQMIRSCKSSRDRALISFMYEAAARPIEVREATWDQITFDQWGAIFNTSKKTGKPRYIRLVKYHGYLAAWRADYRPGIPEGKVRVFVTSSGKELSRQYFDNIISQAAKRAGLTGVFPYILRHSRITAMVNNKIPESVIKLQAWGSLNTPMMATYTHLTNDQTDNILLEAAGIKRVGRPKGVTVHPVQCPHCDNINVPGTIFCGYCGRSLTQQAANEEAEVRQFAGSPAKLRMLADELERQGKK